MGRQNAAFLKVNRRRRQAQQQRPVDLFGREVEIPKIRDAAERALHCAVADYLRVAIRPPQLWFHVPNGELRSKETAGLLKRMGVKPGIPDILVLSPLPICGGGSRMVGIELKPHRRYQSEVQRDCARDLREAGACTAVAHSIDEVEQILREVGIPCHATAGDRR